MRLCSFAMAAMACACIDVAQAANIDAAAIKLSGLTYEVSSILPDVSVGVSPTGPLSGKLILGSNAPNEPNVSFFTHGSSFYAAESVNGLTQVSRGGNRIEASSHLDAQYLGAQDIYSVFAGTDGFLSQAFSMSAWSKLAITAELSFQVNPGSDLGISTLSPNLVSGPNGASLTNQMSGDFFLSLGNADTPTAQRRMAVTVGNGALVGPFASSPTSWAVGSTDLGPSFNLSLQDVSDGVYTRTYTVTLSIANASDQDDVQGRFGLSLLSTSTFITSVPEPSSWALMGLGLVGLRLVTRRKPAH